MSNQRFTDDLMRFRGAFVSKSKEPRRNGFPLIAEPLMRGIFEECLAVDVESLQCLFSAERGKTSPLWRVAW